MRLKITISLLLSVSYIFCQVYSSYGTINMKNDTLKNGINGIYGNYGYCKVSNYLNGFLNGQSVFYFNHNLIYTTEYKSGKIISQNIKNDILPLKIKKNRKTFVECFIPNYSKLVEKNDSLKLENIIFKYSQFQNSIPCGVEILIGYYSPLSRFYISEISYNLKKSYVVDTIVLNIENETEYSYYLRNKNIFTIYRNYGSFNLHSEPLKIDKFNIFDESFSKCFNKLDSSLNSSIDLDSYLKVVDKEIKKLFVNNQLESIVSIMSKGRVN